ncbi:MAG: hypothetical protein V2G33_04205 [bacterium JZ-2024 1]
MASVRNELNQQRRGRNMLEGRGNFSEIPGETKNKEVATQSGASKKKTANSSLRPLCGERLC